MNPNESIQQKIQAYHKPGQDRSIVDAHDDFRRVLSADGTFDGDEDSLDYLRDQFRSIEKEAARAGYLYEDLIQNAVVFDMRPANVFTTAEGIVIPVDCIPVKLPPGKGISSSAFESAMDGPGFWQRAIPQLNCLGNRCRDFIERIVARLRQSFSPEETISGLNRQMT